MRDSRVTVWTNPTSIAVGGTANGPDIQLTADYTGAYVNAVNPGYGLGVELMAHTVDEGDDTDGFTLAFKWQVAPDNAGVAGTYVDWEPIGTIAYDITDTKGFTKDGTIAGADNGLSRSKIKARLKGVPNTYEWARIVVTSGDLEGTATVSVSGWLSDGTDSFNMQSLG